VTSASRLVCGPLVLAAVGCMDPQSGIFAEGWCKTADPQTLQMVDDMEDGDGIPCSKMGTWYVAGGGSLTPPAGNILKAADLPAARDRSFRAQHLTGSVEAGGSAVLGVRLGGVDLTGFQEIQFWARAEGGNLEIRVAVETPSTSGDGDHFGDVATVFTEWGVQGVPNSIALTALTKGTGQVITPDDLRSSLAIEFQLVGESPSFGFWIDDIQLKRPPP
jgi:Carbohydrate binding domain (family 11)